MTSPELIERMNDSMASYWAPYAFGAHQVYQETPSAMIALSGVPTAVCNCIIIKKDDPAQVQEALDTAARWTSESGISVLWWFSPSAWSDQVQQIVDKAGLEPEGTTPAMVLPLDSTAPVPLPDGLEIAEARGADARRDWARLICAGFGFNEEQIEAFSTAEAAIPEGIFDEQFRYVGYLDGKPASGSSLSMRSNLAGIYAVATLPEARKKGLGAAMTRHAVLEGKARGAEAAILQATEIGRPVYERMGFTTEFQYLQFVQS